MESFAPGFSLDWLRSQDAPIRPAEDPGATAATSAEEEALEELAERVSAARTVV